MIEGWEAARALRLDFQVWKVGWEGISEGAM